MEGLDLTSNPSYSVEKNGRFKNKTRLMMMMNDDAALQNFLVFNFSVSV